MLILDGAAVSRALPMAECLSAMETALAGLANGTYWQPPRTQLRPEGSSSLMGMMPAYRVGAQPLWGFKHIIVAPNNHRRGLSSHQGAVLLNDGETGELLALLMPRPSRPSELQPFLPWRHELWHAPILPKLLLSALGSRPEVTLKRCGLFSRMLTSRLAGAQLKLARTWLGT